MPCYNPLKGYRSKTVNPSGKRSIVFNAREAYHDLTVDLPCGQCIGCRLERSRKWAVRCLHEASLYEQNAFITLTYDDKHIPPNGSLRVEDFQKFMKRLRFEFSDRRIRYFHCGEYGESTQRPHYHACLFNFDFPDKSIWKKSQENNLYRSKILERLWPEGQSTIGDVTFESAAYVARYITKKMTGPHAEEHYGDLKPEYVTMSRRPGLGSEWFEKFKSDLYPDDFALIKRGDTYSKCKVPKYYDTLLERTDPQEFAKVHAARKVNAQCHKDNNTPERLAVREEIQILKFQQLKRKFEQNDT